MATTDDYHGQRRASEGIRGMYFDPDQSQERCFRCGGPVYYVEKIGPINGVLFHRSCFRCSVCGQHLTVKSFFGGLTGDDKQLYCHSHAPRTTGSSRVDYHAMGIKHGVESHFKVRESKKFHNEQIRGTEPGKGAAYDTDAMTIRRALNAPRVSERARAPEPGKYDGEAIQIKEALRAQQLRRGHQQKFSNHHFPAYEAKRREAIIKAQKELEAKHRLEEDKLIQTFQAERSKEASRAEKEVDEEWEVKLKELTKKFEKDIAKKKTKKASEEKKYMTMQYEKERSELEKTMTLKKNKKREHATLKLIEKEQQITSNMVKIQSKQMLDLIASKEVELQKTLAEEIDSGKKPVERKNEATDESGDSADAENNHVSKVDEEVPIEGIKKLQVNGKPSEGLNIFMPVTDDDMLNVPQPRPPSCSKKDLYADPSVFDDIDNRVFNIAENDQQTFTDLVAQLTESCTTDLEKVRAIFRWLTVKDLNVMKFESGTELDTPFGLLRGIKFGTETYHVLFMRLCSYAGLHCVEIKGHSKSVGYEPGMKIREGAFLNTWNAVHVDGDWRMVQCNWGARHLVLNKDVNQPAQKKTKKSDKIRYQYDEHYFLTDPCDFILEFWPFDSDWQLIEKPISLEQFEALPFVRSIFFHYHMQLENGTKAVVFADEKGGTQLKIRLPHDHVQDVVFHYQLRFAEDHRRDYKEYKGTKLDRFVYQTTVENHIVFSIHLPATGEYFLEVFANKIDETNKISDDPNAPMMPFRLKCACKFRLVCRKMTGKMHPLPNCATGEWGPMKAIRHFDLRPVTHESGVVNEDNEIEIKLAVNRALQFLAKLHCNGINEHLLDEFVELEAADDVLTIRIRPPQPGQYGLDVFARPEGANEENVTLAHAAKYLINCARVDNPVPLPAPEATPPNKMTKEKWGPQTAFAILGLKAVTHPEPRIRSMSKDPLIVEIAYTIPVQFAYHLIREPDEDHRENVGMIMDEDKSVARFTLNLTRHGNYLLAIYAKDQKNPERVMTNVYNYMVSHLMELSSSPAHSASSVSSNESTSKRRGSSQGIFSKHKK